jgi:hypothetical protein
MKVSQYIPRAEIRNTYDALQHSHALNSLNIRRDCNTINCD